MESIQPGKGSSQLQPIIVGLTNDKGMFPLRFSNILSAIALQGLKRLNNSIPLQKCKY